MKKKELARAYLRRAVFSMEKADSLLFGQDPEMELFPKLHTAIAYAAIALERLEDELEPVVLSV